MEQNKDNRINGNDILREAEASSRKVKPDVAPDETIEFKLPNAKRNGVDIGRQNMEHTAQIRSGAVVRPLKQQSSQSSPVKTEKKLSPIQAAALRQQQEAALRQKQAAANPAPKPTLPQTSQEQPAQIKPAQSGVQRPQTSQAQSGVQRPQTVQPRMGIQRTSAENAQVAVNRAKPAQQMPRESGQRQTPAQMPPKPTARAGVAPVQQRSNPTPSQPVQRVTQQSIPPQSTQPRGASQERVNFVGASGKNVVQRQLQGTTPARNTVVPAPTPNVQKNMPVPVPQTRPRTEDDDFEIDEIATANHRYASKKYIESSFMDSATSAVMSLVKAVIYIVVIIAVSVGLSVFVISTANDVFKFVVDDKIVSVKIPEYASIEDVADALYDSGAIKYKWAFNFWSGLKDSGAEFIPGTYDVSTTLNYDYLRASFKKSTKRTELRVTIPEGYTIDEIIDLLIDSGIGNVGDSESKRKLYKDAFVDVINTYDFNYRFLENLMVTENRIYRLEGYLFPDTYNFYAEYGTVEDSDEEAARKTAVSVISKLLDNFDKKFVSEYYDRCTDLGMTVDQAMIVASMVEKETRYADELGYVSSVFHNRLKYPGSFPYLNSDATIMYAIAHDTGSRLDTMTGEDTNYDTPYNTYTHRGLPPGPIANPGLNAIKYALYPNDTKYFYFVSDSAGRTLFAATEAEHLANINTVRGN